MLALSVLGACGSDGDSTPADQPASTDGPASTDDLPEPTTGGTPSTGGDGTSGTAADPGDPMAAAPALVPAMSFAIEDPENIASVAMAPDGSQIAVVTQAGLGDPITITLYDSASGEVVASTEADGIGLSIVQWMADGRLVAYADRETDPVWRSWDTATLDELAPVALDFTCYTGIADRNTGIVYASDGIATMGEDLCRVDTLDGSVTRTGNGVLVDPERFWLAPGSGGVAVRHYPDPSGGQELVILAGDTLAPVSNVSFAQGDVVESVGTTTWVSTFDGPDRLEPGAIPVPRSLSPEPSDAGTVFVSSNGSDDLVFVSAADGSVIGTISAEWNPSFTSDWSLDDSAYVRITLDGQAEIYRF